MEPTSSTEVFFRRAWHALNMPRLAPLRFIYEHGDFWVTGYDEDDEKRTFVVVRAEGPGSYRGVAFEEV